MSQKHAKMSIKETLGKTKKLLHKTFKNLKKSLIFEKYRERPTNPSLNPTCPDDNWHAIEAKEEKKDARISQKAQTIKDKHIITRSISFADCRGLEGFKEDEGARKGSVKESKGSSFRGGDILSQKMKNLEMMNDSDIDHVLDMEEVLHYYSRLNCPTYVEIVDKFFMDMQSDFHETQPSRSGSMRKIGSGSAHGSTRSLGPLKL